ncbi:MAG: PIN domain-containing protein [Sinobacteraceae bacterium]|nr:PIN domain-containing protein [Nevskiaceae bacterium]
MRTFLDTNVLVYLFDHGAPKKRDTARGILMSHGAELELVLSTQVLQEFYVAVTRKLARPLSPEYAERAVRDLARLPVVPASVDLVLAAVALSRRAGFSFWDAMIVEAALRSGAQELLSEDLQDGREIEGMQIRNPFGTVRAR